LPHHSTSGARAGDRAYVLARRFFLGRRPEKTWAL
jgi:hypothetical protein